MKSELANSLILKGRGALPGVLIAAAECAPLSKTGGLADVVGALPRSLCALGFDARVITPFHRCAKEKYAGETRHIAHFYVDLGWRHQYVGLEKLEKNGICIYLIDSEFYFGDRIYRGGLAEGEQYAFFQRAVLEAIPYMDFEPEVLHCNDWHTAFLPFLIKTQYAGRRQGRLKTVFSIHNIAFQGKFDFGFVSDLLGVDPRWNDHYHIEHHGCVNWMKSACVYADRISTVSPGYAREILTPEFSEGMHEPLLYRKNELCGILNGLDTESYDPARDPALEFNFSADHPENKAKCKLALLKELALEGAEEKPLVAMVTRISSQKGFDILLPALEGIVSLGAVFVLLGTGDEAYARQLLLAQQRWPDSVRICLEYSEALSRRIYAGADFLLMPSAFEPCGLSQLIAMRYGALPVVHEVGGLRDTVVAYNRFTGEGNGFSFYDYSAHTLLETLRYALCVCSDPAVRAKLIAAAMSRDSGFESGALEYGRLYISVLDALPGGFCHDSSLVRFRSPLGAVKCSQSVKLSVLAPAGVEEMLFSTGSEQIAMQRDEDGFSLEFTAPDQPQVIWYSFLLPGGIHLGPHGLGENDCGAWQLTVYDKDFSTPDWAKGRVMYQIFPDRFARGGDSAASGLEYHRSLGRSMEYHDNWNDEVKWDGQGGLPYCPNDFFGGNIQGIISRLDYLSSLGVGALYLNPIFEADSNHRYNTGDYDRIDPILGTREDFEQLCREAGARDIKIILDGVFSHTGDDSRYFNRYGRYDSLGAFQSRQSEYFSWYDFRKHPDSYRCWWNFESLPEVNEDDPGWQKAIITGGDSVLKSWLRRGASGWRLDVADELPDPAIESIRQSAKQARPDCLIIGEVWEDATTKLSYGSRRRYALGRALDSVMNYPLRGALIDFVLYKLDAPGLCRFLLGQKLNYPQPMYHTLMNLLGSHDTARIRTVLALGHDGAGFSRAQQAEVTLSREQNEHASRLQRICAELIFALPGMPCIYYGDEQGMNGLRDPFCRGSFRASEPETEHFYSRIASRRNSAAALSRGDAAFAAPEEDVIVIARFDDNECWLCCANRSPEPKNITVRPEELLGSQSGDLSGKFDASRVYLPPYQAVTLRVG